MNVGLANHKSDLMFMMKGAYQITSQKTQKHKICAVYVFSLNLANKSWTRIDKKLVNLLLFLLRKFNKP